MVEPSLNAPKSEGVGITYCISAHNAIWDELRVCARTDKMVFEI